MTFKATTLNMIQSYQTSTQKQAEQAKILFILKMFRDNCVKRIKISKKHKNSLREIIKDDPIWFFNQLNPSELAIFNYLVKYSAIYRTVFVKQQTIADEFNLSRGHVNLVISTLHYLGLFFKRQRGFKESCVILLDYFFNRLDIRGRLSCVMDAFKMVVKSQHLNLPVKRQKHVRHEDLTHTKDNDLYNSFYYKEDNHYSSCVTNSNNISSTDYKFSQSPIISSQHYRTSDDQALFEDISAKFANYFSDQSTDTE